MRDLASKNKVESDWEDNECQPLSSTHTYTDKCNHTYTYIQTHTCTQRDRDVESTSNFYEFTVTIVTIHRTQYLMGTGNPGSI